jgi:GNAT superfamily N-acetyltransferase
MSTSIEVRSAVEGELDHLAGLWHDAWHDSHAQILPTELTRFRTFESFRERLQTALSDTRVAGPPNTPLGFCIVQGEELYQLFVSAPARGLGVAAALLADAEHRLAQKGVQTPWLACAIGNERAARFYEKSGWRRTGTMIYHPETPTGSFTLEVWRYEKSLTAHANLSTRE